jgi:hypothetical protein
MFESPADPMQLFFWHTATLYHTGELEAALPTNHLANAVIVSLGHTTRLDPDCSMSVMNLCLSSHD